MSSVRTPSSRRALGALSRIWSRSLEARAVALTVALGATAVLIVSGYMSISVRDNLVDARRAQIVSEAGRAMLNAQAEFALAAEQPEQGNFDAAQGRAIAGITAATTNPGTTAVAMLRVPGQEGPQLIQDIEIGGFDRSVVSRQFSDAVASSESGGVYSQPVAIIRGEQQLPGVVTGSIIDIPSVGRYQLYLVFDLSDVQQTLDFVQQTLIVGGLAIVLLIGGVAYLVARLVVSPVRVAAEASERLASGHLEQRLPERGGGDVIATLARSFNRMAESLQRQIRQLADLSRLQQRFVADVSHELRTPLTTIRLAGEVLHDQRHSFQPATARTAELLHTQTKRLEALLAELLEMSRLDAGVAALETSPTNLVHLVEDAIEQVRPLASERGTELVLDAPGGHLDVDVDAGRILRIVVNLLGNAIDHGEGLPVTVLVDSTAETVTITVVDEGVGIAPENLDRVFDRFWRADRSRQRSTGGTGLGLSIAVEDATLHGGAIRVASAPGEGSRFTLTIPRHREAAVSPSLPPSLSADDTAGEGDHG